MNVAIIPARGGSKRIPRKNIKEFGGKPMIAWSIDAAKQSGVFDHIVVSTDDREIASVAIECGAEVPFLRPDILSGDFAGTIPVIKHGAEWLLENGLSPEFVCCIYATAPFILAEDLIRGLAVLRASKADYAFSVTSFPYPIQRALKMSKHQEVCMFDEKMFNIRSQDLEEAWHDAGQFYWGTVDAWLLEKPIFNSNARAVTLPRDRVQDIDTLEDWDVAEWLLKARTLQNEHCHTR